MKNNKRGGRLSLQTQTLRVLSDQQLARVGGGMAGTHNGCTSGIYTIDKDSCSTISDTNPNCFRNN